MDVVDYPREMDTASLLIPSFHTGPMGLLPETEVHVSLMEGPAGLEVVVRPFQSNPENIMQLTCTMRDQPGIVGKLIHAVSELGINVVNEVSSAIDHQNYHRVDMLLDWTTSKYPLKTASSTRVQRHYHDYHSIVPITVQRYIELFESIIQHCGDVLLVENVNGVALPAISLREIHTPSHLQPYGPVTVQRHQKMAYHVEIALPPPLVTRLRLKLKAAKEPLTYILLSETENRTLRAFFPRKEIIARIVHLGFFHVDAPGALSAILGPLARADFNIVTSLLRQNRDGTNVWEAVLEYRGAGSVPVIVNELKHAQAGQELCLWAAQQLVANLEGEDPYRLQECDLQLGLPRYPRRLWSGRVRLSEMIDSSTASPDVKIPSHNPDPLTSSTSSRPAGLIELVRRGRQKATPSIFLSYPHSAKEHATMVRKKLEDRYLIVEYQEPDSETIVDQVVQKIEMCDYFIGIWHSDADSGVAAISPWLHFEYGIAIAAQKRTMIIHSEGMDPRIWKRINPGIAQPEYSDLRFEHQTVPLIDEYCRSHFRDDAQREPSTPSPGNVAFPARGNSGV